ncbi:hypothetical protein [Actinophytocola sp.]|uniref:hypothetical protein n=1 Tax=Actinophytocola sp. TaxID=1872138 RepID=UPI00389B0434
MTSVPEDLSDVVNYVLERADENDLDAIAQAIDQRRRQLQKNTSVVVAVNATVITGNVFPDYLAGLSGVVQHWIRFGLCVARAHVRAPHQAGRHRQLGLGRWSCG